MTFSLIAITLSFLAIALNIASLVSMKREDRLRLRAAPLALGAAEDKSADAVREREECNARQRDLVLWRNQVRPSDREPVFCKRRRARVHIRPLDEYHSQKVVMMKKVSGPT